MAVSPETADVVAKVAFVMFTVGFALTVAALPSLLMARRVVREAEEITVEGDLLRVARAVDVVAE